MVLPLSSLPWLSRQNLDVVSPWAAFVELNNGRYTTQHAACLGNPWQGMLVKTQMNNVLETLVESIRDELDHAFDRRLGLDETQWLTLPLHGTLRMIVSQLSSRFSVGEPLCTSSQNLLECISDKAQVGMRNISMTPFASASCPLWLPESLAIYRRVYNLSSDV